MKRRHFLQLSASVAAGAMVERAFALPSPGEQVSLRIAPVSVELAPQIVVDTMGYNGQSPASVLRMREGVAVGISVTNATQLPKLMQWQGLDFKSHGETRSDSLRIAPGATQTYQVTPTASGTRWYRAHMAPSINPLQTDHNGQFGFLLIEPRSEAGAFDQEVLLAVHRWQPSLAHEQPNGRNVTHRYASFNDKLLWASEPVRVRTGDRVLFRFLNASMTEEVLLHLPGHRFTVVALDGNPVPRRAEVDVLSLAAGERIDAIVKMDLPGKWILGSVDDVERDQGLGICIEYTHQSGPGQWHPPAAIDWSYARFSAPHNSTTSPKQTLQLLLEKKPNGSTQWIANGQSYPDLESLPLRQGDRYRLQMLNATDRAHSVRLHPYNFHLARINQIPISGIVKDTIRLERYNVVEVDL